MSPCWSPEFCIQLGVSFPFFLASISLSLAICKASSNNHFAFLHFFIFGMVLVIASCLVTACLQCYKTLSIVLQALCYQIQSLKSICHLHCTITRDLIQVRPEWPNGFPYFLQIKPEFCNKRLKDLIEAEEIKKRRQEYTEELYKKSLNDLDKHDVTHLEPNILECEVKQALGSITTNKASGDDVIPAELMSNPKR